jgi:NCAIR mutase (PurE)-related protein
MDGALPAVVSGLVKAPVIGVPSPVGYGVAEGGHAALTTMLASCAPGLAVVNIGNGFGAAALAVKILRAARAA